jgi:pimeloyl-ACP methyl ester carboxylesterase
MKHLVNGIELNVRSWGQGPAVLMIHGLGTNHHCFDEAARYVDTTRHRLVLPDLPGFGESDQREDLDYSMASLAQTLGQLLDQLEICEYHVVAHSMGGAVALLLAETHRPLSFACAEGNLVPEDAFMSGKISRLKEQRFVSVYSKWISLVEQSLDASSPDQNALFVSSLHQTSPLCLHRASRSCHALTTSGELARRFAELTCPRLYLLGEHSQRARGVPAVVTDQKVPVVTIPGQGHFLMERADLFYDELVAFVETATDKAVR